MVSLFVCQQGIQSEEMATWRIYSRAIDGRNSFVVKKYNDFPGVAKKINILLSDDSKRDNMALNAREDVINEYSIDEQMNQFEVLIRKILN